MQPRQNISAPHPEQPPAQPKGPQCKRHHSTRTVLATNTHLRVQGCARNPLHPCTLETSPFRGLILQLFAHSSSMAAELPAHNFCFLAALNLPPASRNGQTYPRNSASPHCKTAGVQTFLPSPFGKNPMKNTHFHTTASNL